MGYLPVSEQLYVCYIKGVDNHWANLIGRWTQPETIRLLVHIPVLPTISSDNFVWPSAKELAEAQNSNPESRFSALLENEDEALWRNANGSVWIPDNTDELQLRLCTIAYTGPSGHRQYKPSLCISRRQFSWTFDKDDMFTFVIACIHCLSTTERGMEPRPFGPAFHGTKPNDLLQFDFINVAPGIDGEKYVLMLRDDLSDYKWFFAYKSNDAASAAVAVTDWGAAFGIPEALMSDGPTYFKNETLRLVSKGLKVPHHFELPYFQCSDGTVERLAKEHLWTFRAVASELQIRPEEWVDLLPLSQSVLNNAPSPQRANLSPITSFTGMAPTPP